MTPDGVSFLRGLQPLEFNQTDLANSQCLKIYEFKVQPLPDKAWRSSLCACDIFIPLSSLRGRHLPRDSLSLLVVVCEFFSLCKVFWYWHMLKMRLNAAQQTNTLCGWVMRAHQYFVCDSLACTSPALCEVFCLTYFHLFPPGEFLGDKASGGCGEAGVIFLCRKYYF